MTQQTDDSSLPWAELTDIPDAQNVFRSLAQAADGILVPRYTNFAALAAANTSPQDGQRCVLTSYATPQTYVYRNGAWRLEDIARAVAANQTTSNNTTVHSLSDTSVYLQAGRPYTAYVNLCCLAGASSTKVKLYLVNAAGGTFTATTFGYGMLLSAGTDVFYASYVGYYSGSTPLTIATVDNNAGVTGAMLEVAFAPSVDGAVTLGWGQGTANAATSILYGPATWWRVREAA